MPPALSRRLVEHRLTLIAGLAASLPIIVATVRAVANGWVPLGDDGVIATRSLDVLSLHTPLLGQHSASSAVTGERVNSLGPLLYWLLAIPARIGPAAMTIAIGLANTAAVMGSVALARRRGGPALMFAAAVGIALMCGSLRTEILHSVWNPSAALMPFALLVFLCWSVACGEYRLLPLTVVVASFVAQCHLTFVAPGLGMLAVAGVGLVLARRGAEGSIRPWLVASAAAGLVCWSFPLVDQAINRPGNFVAVAKSAGAGGEKLGASAGWHALVHAFGVPPWWATSPRGGIDTLADVVQAPPAAGQLTAALILAALLLVLAAGVRRRRADIASAAAIALVLGGALALVAADTPTKGILFISIGYTLRWGSIAGMFAWLALGWSAFALVRPRVSRVRPSWLAPAAGVAAAVAAGIVVSARGSDDRLLDAYDPVAAATSRLDADLPPGQQVLVETAKGSTGFDFRFDFAAAIIYDLRRHGRRVFGPEFALGSQYAGPAPAGAAAVVVGGAAPSAPPGALLVGSSVVTETDDRPDDGRPPASHAVSVLLFRPPLR